MVDGSYRKEHVPLHLVGQVPDVRLIHLVFGMVDVSVSQGVQRRAFSVGQKLQITRRHQVSASSHTWGVCGGTHAVGEDALPRTVDDKVDVEEFEELQHRDGAVVELLQRQQKRMKRSRRRCRRRGNGAEIPSACRWRSPPAGTQKDCV